MTRFSRKWWGERLPLIEAFVEGEIIQYKPGPKAPWNNLLQHDLCEFSNDIVFYRPKPKPVVVKSRRFLFLAYTGVVGVTTCSVGIATNQEEVDRWTKAACFIRWIDNDWVETEVSEDTTAGC